MKKNAYKKKQWRPPSKKEERSALFHGQIDLNLEVCISNSMCTGQKL
jgi:hypothetical protein